MIKITKIRPKISLENGYITIYGENLNPWKLNSNCLFIDQDKNLIFKSANNNKIIAKLPPNISSSSIQIRINKNSISNLYPHIIINKIYDGFDIYHSPVFDKYNMIYFANFKDSNSVIKITPDTKQITHYIQNIDSAISIIFDQIGNLYIASFNTGRIYKFDGKITSIFTEGIEKIFSIGINQKNEIFVSDLNGNIYKLDSNGRAFFYSKIPKMHFFLSLKFDQKDQIYVSSPHLIGKSYIYKISEPDKKLSIFYSSSYLIYGFAFDNKNNLYTIENSKRDSQVIKINLETKKKSLLLNGTDLTSLSFNKNNDLVISSKSSIFIVPSSFL